MKLLASLFIVWVIVTSCMSTVQVVTLRGSNVQPAADGLVLDNDTLTLQYSFASERGQMHITIVNKLNQPLYVDWQRSSFIIGQKKINYWYDVANVKLATSGYVYQYGKSNFSSTGSSTEGTISKDLPIAFIPPRTKATKRQFIVFPNRTVPMPGTPVVNQEQARWASKKVVNVRTYTYPLGQSPLQFRKYLTLSTDKNFKTEFYIDTQFWASDVRIEPQPQAVDILQKQPDGSYIYSNSFAQKDGFFVFLSKK